MKITLTRMSDHTGYDSRKKVYAEVSDDIEHQLFGDLYHAAYQTTLTSTWIKFSATLHRLDHIIVDLSEMAALLRAQDWCVYYWRDVKGILSDDYNTQVNYGTREGLIFGRYCPNLTAWLLANT